MLSFSDSCWVNEAQVHSEWESSTDLLLQRHGQL
jgi:hypothetical protein